MTSFANSQQLLSDSTAIVPIKALKYALSIKSDRDYLAQQLVIARDSIAIQDSIIIQLDAYIQIQETQIGVFKANEKNYEEILFRKDKIIQIKEEELKDSKKKIRLYQATTGAVSILLILLLI